MSAQPSQRRIVFAITSLDYGGAETQLVRLAVALSKRDWRVAVVVLRPPKAFTDVLAEAGIEVVSLEMRRGRPTLAALGKMVAFLRRRQPHLLVNFLFHADLLGRFAGRLAGVPVVVSSLRSGRLGGRGREWMMRLTNWMADGLTANSQLVADEFVRRGVIPAGRVQVIPNGLEVHQAEFTPEQRRTLREDLGVGPDQFLWLAVGRLEDPKDYPTLLAAFVAVARAYPHAQLRIAGQGPLAETLTAQVAHLGLTGRVQLLGLRQDVPHLLRAADAYVLSSAWEALPNALMEAALAARPVVATRVGGVPEIIAEGAGLLVEPCAPEALGDAMRRLMDLPPEARRRMGDLAQTRVGTRFGMEQVVALWERLFLTLEQDQAPAPGEAHTSIL